VNSLRFSLDGKALEYHVQLSSRIRLQNKRQNYNSLETLSLFQFPWDLMCY